MCGGERRGGERENERAVLGNNLGLYLDEITSDWYLATRTEARRDEPESALAFTARGHVVCACLCVESS